MKFKRIIPFVISIISLTLLLALYLSTNVKNDVHSQEGMYYDITHNPAFPKVDGIILDMALNANGSILYVGGFFSEIGDIGTEDVYARSNLAAINTADYSVTSWAPQADGEVFAIEVYGGSIYVGGSFNSINATYTGEFAKIGIEGTLDSTCVRDIYTSLVPSTVRDISITNDYIYVAGSFNKIVDDEEVIHDVFALVRLNNDSTCTWDESWQPVLDGPVNDVEVNNGAVYIGGSFNSVGGILTGDFAKFNSEGSLDDTCLPYIHTLAPTDTVYDIAVTNDYIYVGGSFDRVVDDSNEVTGLVRLNANDCTWDSSWVPDVGYSPTIFTITPIGENVFIGGSFDYIGTLYGSEFALLDGTSGDSINYWNPAIDGETGYGSYTVYSSLLKDNKIYVGGSFTQVLGEQVSGYGLASFSYSYDAIPTIQINTIEDLNSMRENLMANYTLMRDLDFENCSSYADCNNRSTYTEGLGWEPIGYYDGESDIVNPYLGTFDGQGHTISNLYINRPLESSIGLFGIAGELSEIKNVGLISAQVSGGEVVGGLVGELMGTVEKAYTKGDVTGTTDCTGGLVGEHWIEGSAITATILNSYSEASVSGGYSVGGLVGCNTGDVINSYSTGSVTVGTQIGGLIGWYGGGDISNSYWDTDTSGILVSDGGLGLTTEAMQSLTTYAGWDIVAMNGFDPSDPYTWYINDGEDYPRLSWEYEAPEVITKAVSNFTANGATLNGELVSMDGESSVSVYFRYRQGEGEWTDVNAITKTTTGVFSSSITGLTLNTQYSYQAVVTWREVGTVYGNIVSFTTPETPPLPTVFGPVVSNIEEIQNPDNIEVPLVLTKIGTGSITFPSGLNLTDNYEQLSNLSENLVIVYEPSLNRFRAYVNSNGASFLATNGATIRFFNVRSQLGITGLTSSNFKTLLKVSVLDDSKSVVGDTSSYYDWNNASYNQDTDILTIPVNHFSEYVLGVNTGVLPSTGMSSLTMLIPFGISILGLVLIIPKKKIKK